MAGPEKVPWRDGLCPAYRTDLREERWGRDPLFVSMLLYLLPGF